MSNPSYAEVVAKIGREAFECELDAFRDWQRTVHAIRTSEAAAAAVQRRPR